MSGGNLYWSDVEPKFTAISNRLAAIEQQLARLSELAGVPYTPPADDVPPSVVALVRAGKTMEAIKEYRAITGAGIDEARQAVSKV
jgi:ribosomal protein L7/L12